MSAGPSPARVLLVEDDPMQAQLAAAVLGHVAALELAGHAATVAQAQQWLQDNTPDVVLLDFDLPDGTGADLLEWMRDSNRSVPVLLLTARDNPIELAQRVGAAAGSRKDGDWKRVVDQLVRVAARTTSTPATKASVGLGLGLGLTPYALDADAAQALVPGVVTASGATGALTAAESGPVTSGRIILVADDDSVCLNLIELHLQAANVMNPRVHVTSGTDAVAILEQRATEGPQHLPALVLLDSQMPGLTGLEVLRWMHEHVPHVPAILLSAKDDALDVTAAYELGARSYLVKPVGFEALAGVIRELQLPWRLM